MASVKHIFQLCVALSFLSPVVAVQGVQEAALKPRAESKFVSVLAWGAKGDGIADDSAALQAAIGSGAALDFGDPGRTYNIKTTIVHTGKVVLRCNGATLRSDVLTFKFTDATGSIIRDCKFLPLTTPITIKRDSSDWKAMPTATLEGYMPTPQDPEYKIWASSYPKVLDQGELVHPGIYFNVSSSAGGKHIEVSGMSGRSAVLIVEGYTDSLLHSNDFGGNGFTYGGIVIVNGIDRAYNSEKLDFTLPRGTGWRVCNNKLRYASYSGIVWFGVDEIILVENESAFNGESGYKAYSYDGVPGPSESEKVISSRYILINNHANGNYYDGFDLQTFYGIPHLNRFGGSLVSANGSEYNRHTGFTSNGSHMHYESNTAIQNGTFGFVVLGNNNRVLRNSSRYNCTTGVELVPQCFDFQIQGDDVVSIDNDVVNENAVSKYNYLHSGLGGKSPTKMHEGTDAGNRVSGGLARMHVSPNIRSKRP